LQEGIDVETKTKKDYFQRLDAAAKAGGVCLKLAKLWKDIDVETKMQGISRVVRWCCDGWRSAAKAWKTKHIRTIQSGTMMLHRLEECAAKAWKTKHVRTFQSGAMMLHRLEECAAKV
jgi:hypothetical protein